MKHINYPRISHWDTNIVIFMFRIQKYKIEKQISMLFIQLNIDFQIESFNHGWNSQIIFICSKIFSHNWHLSVSTKSKSTNQFEKCNFLNFQYFRIYISCNIMHNCIGIDLWACTQFLFEYHIIDNNICLCFKHLPFCQYLQSNWKFFTIHWEK